ncbi:MAG: hypothetical protein V4456_11555 [Bacteroidota bacterium]
MNKAYDTLTAFIKRNKLVANQKVSTIVAGNLLTNNFLFQDILSNLFFFNFSEDADGIAVGIDTISFIKLENGEVWYKS